MTAIAELQIQLAEIEGEMLATEAVEALRPERERLLGELEAAIRGGRSEPARTHTKAQLWEKYLRR
jgi:hypothetical protein